MYTSISSWYVDGSALRARYIRIKTIPYSKTTHRAYSLTSIDKVANRLTDVLACRSRETRSAMETRPPNDGDSSAPSRRAAVNSTRLGPLSRRGNVDQRASPRSRRRGGGKPPSQWREFPVCVMLPQSLPEQERFFTAARSSVDRHFAVG